MAWVSPTVRANGFDVTATEYNEFVNNFKAIGDAWTSYTPTLAQGASSNISKTVTYAKYVQAGKWVTVEVLLSATGAGSAGSQVTVSLPVTAAVAGTLAVGSFWYNDNGTSYYVGTVLLNSTTTVQLIDAKDRAAVGITPNIAVASGDEITFCIGYEAA